MAEVGADIAIGYARKEQAARVLSEHIHQMGRRALPVRADLSKPTQVQALVDQAKEGDLLQIANLLCPGNIVVSGTQAACEAVERLAPEMGAMKTIRLAVAGAFHTDLMKPADQALAAALNGVDIKPPTVPVWSNVDAKPHTDPAEIRALLVRQVISPVRWD